MKENISIIFAAIIGTFLIVILPLFSILDRQDSMSYNVVLTETTNFVDNIRKNGFIDKEAYQDYLSAIASTSNTYKVTIEAYKNILIPETDELGNIIENSYVEQKELYNTQDILEVLYNEEASSNENANLKNNVYLLDVNDEVYVRVYNTNVTSGSLLYSLIAGPTNNKVINISYGGVVNKINWELYNKVQSELVLMPEVIMSVPVNSENSTNVQLINESGDYELIDCSLESLDDYIGNIEMEELCRDILEGGKQSYSYIYDLSEPKNKTIRVAVELRRFYKIDIGSVDEDGNIVYTELSKLAESLFNDVDGVKSSAESHIIKNYIRLNGMYANIDLRLRQKEDYYVFDIVLSNVTMSALDYIASPANISILAGLGEDENGNASLSGESISIELVDENVVNTVTISAPHKWNKLIKTKNPSESIIGDNVVYANEDLAFIISYTGINGQTEEDILEGIRNSLRVYADEAEYSNLEFYTADQLNEQYGVNIKTDVAGHVLVKMKYTAQNESRENYIKLLEGWIETNIDDLIDTETGEEVNVSAIGAQSPKYQVLLDNSAPLEPDIAIEGTEGNNGWYKSDVTLTVIPSTSDTVIKNGNIIVGGSGVDRHTITLEGAIKREEQEVSRVVLNEDGTTYATAKAYDYVGNVVETRPVEIKIDKTAPTAPNVALTGDVGTNGWYTSNVTVNIAPGTDSMSGVEKTTYRITGANEVDETQGITYTLTESGKSTVIASTYDKAGNVSETRIDVFIDTTLPPDAVIEVIEGEKNSPDTEWYATDVKLRITVASGDAISGFAKAAYRITGNSEVPTTEFTETTKDVIITENGTHNITVYTYTQAGNVKINNYTVQIDKSAPNPPTLEVVKGTEGAGEWYTSNVEVQVKSNGDVGTSVERLITYTITNNGTTSIEKEIKNNETIPFEQEGEYILTVYSWDTALNKSEIQKVIKIDKTKPEADFEIEGTLGKDNWYISDVNISSKNVQDNLSGINNIDLSQDSITQNTDGTVLVLTVTDNAGNILEKTTTIKIDKTAPTKPEISIVETPTGTNSFTGVVSYNHDVTITITPGQDSHEDITTYKLTKNGGTNILVEETTGLTYKTTQEGLITVVATTYDKAGNSSSSSEQIWIDKTKPRSPKILSINGENVEDVSAKEIVAATNRLSLELSGISVGNDVKVILINQSTYERIEIMRIKERENTPIEVEITDKGTYTVAVTQINMFGSESDQSTGLYYYKYQ